MTLTVLPLQEFSGMAVQRLFQIGRLARKYQVAAGIACFRAKVNDPVGTFDHIGIMLDNDDGMALFNQCIKRSQ